MMMCTAHLEARDPAANPWRAWRIEARRDRRGWTTAMRNDRPFAGGVANGPNRTRLRFNPAKKKERSMACEYGDEAFASDSATGPIQLDSRWPTSTVRCQFLFLRTVSVKTLGSAYA